MTRKNTAVGPNGPEPCQGERGSVLIIALFLIFAAAVLGSVLAMVSSVDLRISGNQRKSTDALYVAEAGLNEATHRLSLPNPTTATFGTWTGNIAIGDDAPYDPNWTARIYLTAPGAAPAGGASDFNTGTLQDLTGSYLKFSAPSGTDNVLTIKHKWEDLNGNGVRDANEIVLYDRNVIPPENFTTGFPIEIIDVTGQAGQGSRTIEAEVTKLPLFARALGALYIDKAIHVNGTPAFCGYNHSINTPEGTLPNACFAWHLGSGHKAGITTTGDEVDVSGAAADILGQPAPTDTSSANPFYELWEVLGLTENELDQVLLFPDFTAIPGTGRMDGITYIQGDATVNSNLEGSGLLYITGSATINGDLMYRGLIYIENDLKVTGNPWILGSVIVRGTSDYSFSAGNAGILFSEEAIHFYVGKFFPMQQLSWREL
jgi:hypothetical protein